MVLDILLQCETNINGYYLLVYLSWIYPAYVDGSRRLPQDVSKIYQNHFHFSYLGSKVADNTPTYRYDALNGSPIMKALRIGL